MATKSYKYRLTVNNVRWNFLIFLLCLSGLPMTLNLSLAGSTLSAVEVNEITQKIRINEDTMRNAGQTINVESTLQVEKWIESKDAWEKTPLAAHAVSFYSLSGEKCKIEVQSDISEWKDGKNPYLDASYSICYDNGIGTTLWHNTGYGGNIVQEKRGKIEKGIPEKIKGYKIRALTGAGYFLLFFENDPSFDKFSGLLIAVQNAQKAKQPSFSFTRESFLGRDCIKMASDGTEHGSLTYWLDPQKGYCLVGLLHTNKRKELEWIIRDVKVINLAEILPGIWYPTEVIEENAAPDEQLPLSRMVYKAEKIMLVNNVDIQYKPDLPSGYTIDDKIKGKTYCIK